MSANVDEDKEPQKALPLDLARTQITTVRTVESNKAPLVMSSQALRNVRVLQGVNAIPASVGQTIITNLVPGTMIKQDTNRTQITGLVSQSPSQSGGITIQRPTQITLSATPLVSAQSPPGTSYHVPRGPAVVANLAAPRSNVTTIRTPLVVTAQNSQTFARPPRTPSPAQAWLTTNSTNGGQIKGTPTVLGSPIRGPTVTGKPQTVIGRPQSQQLPTIRGTILSNAITIGQTLHSFKPASGTIQLGGTVTVAQMLPARTQPVVYSTNTGAQFTPTARLTLATSSPGQMQMKPGQPRPMGNIVSGARLTVPLAQVQAAQNTRIVAPGNLRTTQPQVLTTGARLVTSQPSGNLIGRISTANVTNPGNILTSQARISTLSTLNIQSLMAVANGAPARLQQTSQGPKVITQPAATIHLTPIPSQIKTTPPIPIVTTGTRTINVPASIVAQRPLSGGAISIAKVFTTTENPSVVPATASVFIHAPLQAPRLPVPSPQNAPTSTPHQQQLITSAASTQGPTYPLTAQEGTTGYFYESPATPTGAFQRAFVSQQQNSFISQPQSQPQIIRPAVPVCNQQFQGMRFNSVMVVEQSRAQQSTAPFQPIVTSQVVAEPQNSVDTTVQQQQQTAQNQNKATSSPRPSILRKRDHEGTPLKAAKNLMQALQTAPPSPPSPPRPDSRDNGHSSGSTTISATSSPGLGEINEDSNPLVVMNVVKDEEEEDVKPALEMSPRKKPRKQQLTTNSKNDTALNHGDMQFISENNAAKKENNYDSDEEPYSDSVQKNGGPEIPRIATLRKPASFTLLNGYRQNWKATHNHYQRYSDVKPKEDKRPSIIDLANQNRVLEKINGWKVYHLSTQMDDLAQQEHSVYGQLTDLLKFTESEETSRHGREVNTVNELIKGNLQRIKIINDGMLDAKCQIMKVFEHQRHVNDILSRCARTRNFKKREKS